MGGPSRGHWTLAALVFLVALNLRPPITSVGPLLPQIGAEFSMDKGVQGLLGALPLIAFAVVSPLVHFVSRRFGPDLTMFAALLVLTAGTVIRSYTGNAGLWIGTVIVGSAIAVGNVLMPTLVKRDYGSRVSLATGAYTACINIAAGVASALAVPLANAGGWRWGLSFWAIPALIVALLWILRLRALRAPRFDVDTGQHTGPDIPQSTPTDSSPDSKGSPEPTVSVWRQPTAWLLTAFMGMQSLTFYVLVNWLPTIEATSGISPEQSGVHLLLFQAVGAFGGLAISRLLRQTDSQVTAAITASVLVLIGVLGLLLLPSLGALWAIITGMGVSSSFVVCLTLMSLRGRTSHETTSLSGMAQSLGYLGAAAGPVVAGILADATGSWTASLVLLVVFAALQIVVAGLAGRVPADRR